MSWVKLSAAMGSGLPDPDQSAAASQPTPVPSIANKPAPGQTGPRGLAPRSSFTRVNTGAPPVPDAGASAQKTQPPRGMEFLRAKMAHQEKTMSTTMMRRPDLNSMIKEAMEGTVDKIDIHGEIERQMQHTGESTKVASAEVEVDSVPTEYAHKLASALKHLAKQASMGPGQGPGSLPVSTPSASGSPPGPGGQGKAHHQPEAPTMASSGVAKDPPTGFKTDMNDKVASLEASNLDVLSKLATPLLGQGNTLATVGKGMSTAKKALIAAGATAAAGGAGYGVHKALKKDDDGEKTAKDWSGTAKNLGAMAKHHGAGAAREVGAAIKEHGLTAAGAAAIPAVGYGTVKGVQAAVRKSKGDDGEKKASGLPIDAMFELFRSNVEKVAEDALNPAHISSAGSAPAKNPPPGVNASEENAPSIPSLISSNMAVINATRRQTKAQPKAELKSVLSEPALTSSTDSTLNQAWSHTGEAGAKIASQLTRVAAAQVLLSKLAEDAKCADKPGEKKKEKNSSGMGGLNNPSGQSGFNAASVGGS